MSTRHALVPWALVLALGGCAPEAEEHVRTGPPGGAGVDGDGDSGGAADSGGDSGGAADTGVCGASMVLVPASSDVDAFCIDVVEASLEERSDGAWQAASPYQTVGEREVRAVAELGAVPQGYISGDEAAVACAAAGKRLCTSAEWLRACRGPAQWTWPYGDAWVSGACNDDYAGSHPVVDYFGTSEDIWDSTSMNDPGINQQDGTVAPGGAHPDCVSAFGAYDLHRQPARVGRRQQRHLPRRLLRRRKHQRQRLRLRHPRRTARATTTTPPGSAAVANPDAPPPTRADTR